MDSVKMKTMGYRRVASVLIRADRVLACYLPLFTSGAVLSQKHLSIVWKCTELRFTRGVLSFRGDISGVISRRDSRIPENGSVKNGKNWILRIPFFFFPQPSCARYGKKKKEKNVSIHCTSSQKKWTILLRNERGSGNMRKISITWSGLSSRRSALIQK